MTPRRAGLRVFVTNLGFHDYSPATRFGPLVPITRGRVDIEHTDRLEHEIYEAMAEMEEFDYLLVSGSPVITAICTGHALRRFGSVNLVYWDPLMRDYHIREMDFQRKEPLA